MSVRAVAGVLGGFALIVAIAVAGIGYGLHGLATRDRATQGPLTREQAAVLTIPGPHLQARPFDDLHALQAHQNALLSSYAWADGTRSVARIPIGRAMALVVGRSLDPGGKGGVAP